MKIIFSFSWFVFSLLAFVACKENEFDRDIPRILTKEVSDISEEGATFNAQAVLFGNTTISDHGFVWSINPKPKYGNSEFVKLGEKLESGEVQAHISTTLEDGERYYVRSFALVKGLTVYGNEMSFISLGSKSPIVEKIRPEIGDLEDTILVTGKNFSNFIEKTGVKFGEVEARIISVSPDSIYVQVPSDLTSPIVPVKVSILGNVSSDDVIFKIGGPQIFSVNPIRVLPGNTVIVTGKNFVKGRTEVFLAGDSIGDIQYDFINNYPNYTHNPGIIRFKVPNWLANGKSALTLKVFNHLVVAKDSIDNGGPEIIDFFPKSGSILDTIHFRGINVEEFASAKIGGFPATYLRGPFPNEFDLIVPGQVNVDSAVIEIRVTHQNRAFTLVPKDKIAMNPPEVEGLTKISGLFGNTTYIYGGGFNYETEVYFGNTQADVHRVTADSLEVAIPDLSLGLHEVFVVGYGQTVKAPVNFELVLPVIDQVSQQVVEVGDTIWLFGNFSEDEYLNTVFVDDSEAVLTGDGCSNVGPMDSLQFQVPIPDFSKIEHDITLTLGKNSITLPNALQIKPPEVYSVGPASVGYKDVFSVTGYFPFLGDKSGVTVKIGNTPAEVLWVQEDEMLVEVNNTIAQGTYDLILTIEGQEYTYTQIIGVPWKKGSSVFPENLQFGFTIDNTAYAGSISGSIKGGIEFYAFDPSGNTWSSRSNLPESNRLDFYEPACQGFTLDGKGYILFRGRDENTGGQVNRFLEYDPSNDQWKELTTPPLKFRGGYSFMVDGRALVGTGIIMDTTTEVSLEQRLWEYDHVNQLWIDKAKPPVGNRLYQNAFSVEGTGYIVGGNSANGVYFGDMWAYDPLTNVWEAKADYPGLGLDRLTSFVNFGKAYVGVARSELELWQYDHFNDSWLQSARPSYFEGVIPDIFSVQYVFTLDNITYLSAVIVTNYPNFIYDPEVWEFDSNFLK